MANRLDPEHRIPADLARAILALPDRDRIQVYTYLRRDLDEAGALVERQKADDLNERMQRSIKSLLAIKERLGLDEEAFLALKMNVYDEAAEQLEECCAAVQAAAPFDRSWPMAKQAALGGRLPITQQQKWKRKTLSRRAARSRLHFAGVAEWLETAPAEETMDSYNEWCAIENGRVEVRQKLAAATTIRQRYNFSWEEVVAQARCLAPGFEEAEDEEDEEELVRLPVHSKLPELLTVEQLADFLNIEQADAEQLVAAGKVPYVSLPSPHCDCEVRRVPLGALIASLGGSYDLAVSTDRAQPEELLYEKQLVAWRLRKARAAMGWNKEETARRAGLASCILSKIERGHTRELAIATVVRLANAFNVSTDFFLSPDGAED